MKCLAIIATILQAVVFVCVVVATPIDVFRSKEAIVDDYHACYSMWGVKRCGIHKANPKIDSYALPNKGFPCKHVLSTMNAAAAFAIISIFLALLVLVLCVLLICNCIGGGMIPAIVGIIAFCTILVSWACVTGSFHYGDCTFTAFNAEVKMPKISEYFNLYAGFGLMVTAWILQLITVILLFLA